MGSLDPALEGSRPVPCRRSNKQRQYRTCKMYTLVYVVSLLFCVAQAQIFRLPEARACEQRIIHADRFGKSYHFSWLEAGPNKKMELGGCQELLQAILHGQREH